MALSWRGLVSDSNRPPPRSRPRPRSAQDRSVLKRRSEAREGARSSKSALEVEEVNPFPPATGQQRSDCFHSLVIISDRRKMKATVISQSLPLGTCSVRTDTDVLAVFRLPSGASIDLGDVLELDLLALDRPQEITNATKGQRLSIEVRSHDVHDLRLPAGHGTSRFPAPERRADPVASANSGAAHRSGTS